MINFKPMTLEQLNAGLYRRKQELANQYYGRNIESEIYNRNQQGKLLGEQAQWYGPKSQAEIDLINKGQIPHYQAQSGLLGQQTLGQKLNNQYERMVMPYKVGAAEYLPEEARNHAFLTGQQGLEAGSRSRKESAEAQKLNELINYIHDVYGNNNENIQQQPKLNQPSQNNSSNNNTSYNYPTNMPSLNEEQKKRIDDNLKKHNC